jgi:hypothetical protein
MATFSMAPAAKPTTRMRPFQAMHFVDLSTRPTGSKTMSTPRARGVRALTLEGQSGSA